MSGKDTFSKHLPNIKLATRYDADGKEIQVEVREDKEQNDKQQEIIDLLVAAGYFRARIKGLSAFDKIIGGMTWCIESCDYDVDIDLLFNENLTIGQKIALTEKIVVVLPKMSCPFIIEPHQIQGLDFINIFPVIQWLVKKSVENRAEKAEKLKKFAVSQFHNHFRLPSDDQIKQNNLQIIQNLTKVKEMYGPKRQFKRKDAGPNDEKSRVRLTLLEYGNRNNIIVKSDTPKLKNASNSKSVEDEGSEQSAEDIHQNESDVEQLLKNLSVNKEESLLEIVELNEFEREMISKNFAELKSEMTLDATHISELNEQKIIAVKKLALDKKLEAITTENQKLQQEIDEENDYIAKASELGESLNQDILEMEEVPIVDNDENLLDEVQELVLQNEKLKQQEIDFKDNCKKELAQLQSKIKNAEEVTPDEDLIEFTEELAQEEEKLKNVRLQLAKKNRATVALQRQLDDIPDRTELAQYQKRFLELHNQVTAKLKETKQFYDLYNSLNDTKLYMEKEITLLSSIYDNYTNAMSSLHSREQFLKQFEAIVEGIKSTKSKWKNKCDDEKYKRDDMNAQLSSFVDQQRKYAVAVKQLTEEGQNNEALVKRLKYLEMNKVINV